MEKVKKETSFPYYVVLSQKGNKERDESPIPKAPSLPNLEETKSVRSHGIAESHDVQGSTPNTPSHGKYTVLPGGYVHTEAKDGSSSIHSLRRDPRTNYTTMTRYVPEPYQ